MKTRNSWNQVSFVLSRWMPIVRHLPSGAREGLVLGLAGGALLFAVLGALFGGLNRGSEGAVIGALSGAVAGGILGAIAGAVVGRAKLPQRGTLQVRIELDGPSRRAPGDRVAGYVCIEAQDTLKIGLGKVYFVCRGFYGHDDLVEGESEPQFTRESRQYLVREADVVPSGTVRARSMQRYPFEVRIPGDALPTHHGYITSVLWTLYAVIDVHDMDAVTAQKEVYVEAQSPNIPRAQSGYRSTTTTPECQANLAIPKATYEEGETLSGSVYIYPTEEIDADEIRVVLLRIENTPIGDNHMVFVGKWDSQSGQLEGDRRPGGRGTTYVWLEGEALLSGPVHLSIAQAMTHEFSIDIPAQWRPTLITKDGQVIWKLGLVIACSGGDIRAFHEVIVHTSPAPVDEILSQVDQSTETV